LATAKKNKPIRIISSDKTVLARVFFNGTKYATQTDSLGKYSIDTIAEGNYKSTNYSSRFSNFKKSITVKKMKTTF
jgi:outer membrane receptor for ferrienterochelin and colicins